MRKRVVHRQSRVGEDPPAGGDMEIGVGIVEQRHRLGERSDEHREPDDHRPGWDKTAPCIGAVGGAARQSDHLTPLRRSRSPAFPVHLWGLPTTPRRVSADKEQAGNIPLVVQRSPIRVAKRHAQNSKPIAGMHRVVSTISYHYFSNLSMTE